ncbi:TRAP transporter substrate-binding protein [Chloroflexota bacterium]
MKRILLISLMAVVVISIVFGGCAKSAPVQTITWKFSGYSSEGSYPTNTLRWWADEVEKKTNGQLKIDVYIAGSSPYKSKESLKSLRENLMEGAEVWAWAVGGEVQEIKVTSLPGFIPYGIEFREQLARDFESDFAGIMAKHNAYLYAFVESSERNIYLKEPANTLAEVKGRKLRSAGKEEQALSNNMGAVGTVMPGAEVYTSIQKGILDGVWHIDDTALTSKWYEILNYIVTTNWGGAGCYFCLNQTALDALPKDVRDVVIDLQPKFKDVMFENLAKATKESRATLLKEGMEEITWPKADMDKLAELSNAIAMEWYQSTTPEAQKIYDKIEAYISKSGQR